MVLKPTQQNYLKLFWGVLLQLISVGILLYWRSRSFSSIWGIPPWSIRYPISCLWQRCRRLVLCPSWQRISSGLRFDRAGEVEIGYAVCKVSTVQDIDLRGFVLINPTTTKFFGQFWYRSLRSSTSLNVLSGEGARLPEYIDVQGCSGHCTVPSGVERKVTLGLKLRYQAKKLIPAVSAKYMGTYHVIPAPILCNGNCPKPNQLREFSFPVTVNNPTWFQITPTVTAKLYDENSHMAMCVQFHLTIKP